MFALKKDCKSTKDKWRLAQPTYCRSPFSVPTAFGCKGPCHESQSISHNKLPETDGVVESGLGPRGQCIASLLGADTTPVVQQADATGVVADVGLGLLSLGMEKRNR